MKNAIKTAGFALCLAIFAQGATVPVQDMSAFSLAAEYYGSLNGHSAMYIPKTDETEAGGKALAAHILRLHYTPIPYVRISAGIGGSHYSGDDLDGVKAGLAATAGAALYLPKPISILSLTAGYDWQYLKASADDDDKTTGMLHVPYAGVIFHIGRFLDFEVGGLWRYFNVEVDSELLEEPADTTSKQIRLYSNITLHERESGAFLSIGANFAPSIDDDDKDKNALVRYSLHGQIGIVLRDPRSYASKKAKSEYSDTYVDLKDRQDSMADALMRDIDRDKERNREEGRDENDFSESEE